MVAQIDGLPGRAPLAGRLGQPPTVIVTTTRALCDLFALNDELTGSSGDAPLADEVRALGGLSRAKDQAAQQRAFLYAALIETR